MILTCLYVKLPLSIETNFPQRRSKRTGHYQSKAMKNSRLLGCNILLEIQFNLWNYIYLSCVAGSLLLVQLNLMVVILLQLHLFLSYSIPKKWPRGSAPYYSLVPLLEVTAWLTKRWLCAVLFFIHLSTQEGLAQYKCGHMKPLLCYASVFTR